MNRALFVTRSVGKGSNTSQMADCPHLGFRAESSKCQKQIFLSFLPLSPHFSLDTYVKAAGDLNVLKLHESVVSHDRKINTKTEHML